MHKCRIHRIVVVDGYLITVRFSGYNAPVYGRQRIHCPLSAQRNTRSLHRAQVMDPASIVIQVEEAFVAVGVNQVRHRVGIHPAIMCSGRQHQHSRGKPMPAQMRRLPGAFGMNLFSSLGYGAPPFGTAGIAAPVGARKHERAIRKTSRSACEQVGDVEMLQVGIGGYVPGMHYGCASGTHNKAAD